MSNIDDSADDSFDSRLSDGLDSLLEASTPSERLAYELATADIELLQDLRAARIQQGLSQEGLADLLGVSPARVREFEGGLTEPTLSTVRRYAHALSVKIHHRVTPFDFEDSSTASPAAEALDSPRLQH